MKSFVAYPHDSAKSPLQQDLEPTIAGKLLVHFELYKKVKNIEGSIVKCGITAHEGLTRFAIFRKLTDSKPGQKVIAFEKFTGETSTGNNKEKSRFSQKVNLPLPDATQPNNTLHNNNRNDKIEFIPGNLGDAIPDYLIENPELKIAYFHIDLDDYESTLTALQFFYPRLVHEGILVLDNYYKQEEDFKAINDYFEKTDVNIENYTIADGPNFIVRR